MSGRGALGVPRMLAVTWWLHLKTIATSAFEGFLQMIWPLFFATTAFLVFRVTGDPGTLVYSALGASVMGMWSTIATIASNTLQRERWMGTLELLVASPTPFALTVVPITLATATVGLYSMVATLLWAWVVFDIPLHIENPLVFALSVVFSIASVAMVGFLLSVTVIRYRTAWALGNLLEYPGWLVCGFLVPLALFPTWVRFISYALPPTWGMRAIRHGAAGHSAWTSLAICAALGIAYAVAGALLSEVLLRSARRRATLSLT